MTASALVFSVASGEYIAVEKVESIYKKNLIVEQVGERMRRSISGNSFLTRLRSTQVWVYGSSFKSCVVAVVVPSPTGIQAWATSKGITGDIAEICANPKAKEAMMAVGLKPKVQFCVQVWAASTRLRLYVVVFSLAGSGGDREG